MKTAARLAIIATVAEVLLFFLGTTFGEITFEDSRGNALGNIWFIFHFPVAMAGAWAFGLRGVAQTAFVIFIGAFQFFMIGLLICAVSRLIRSVAPRRMDGRGGFRCFQCSAMIPHGHDRCAACGWTWT